MRSDRAVLLLGSVILVAACGNDAPPTTPTPAPAAFVRVDIEGPTMHYLGPVGETLQLRAIATMSDGSRPDVTNEAAWSVTDPRVLTVSARGLVTALAEGGTIVTAGYRERAGVTNVLVAPEYGPRFPVTGVVRDAAQGTPLVGADLRSANPADQALLAVTDGNGYFDLGSLAGRATFVVRKLGYADRTIALPGVVSPTSLDVRLDPNPGSYIERRLTSGLDRYDGVNGTTTIHISTRAGGVFDAEVRSSTCDYNGTLGLSARSGDATFDGRPSYCYGRVRFVVPASDVELTIRGQKTSTFDLTYREPR